MVTILLAAGESKRMGRAKLLLPYNNKPLIIHSLTAAIESSSRVIVVTGFFNKEIEKAVESYLDRCEIVVNPTPHLGQFSSIQCGVKLLDGQKEFFLALADMPLIKKEHYLQLIPFLHGHSAVRPFYGQRPGHPVLCSPKLEPSILDTPADSAMHNVLEDKKVYNYRSTDKAYITDIDTPDSYENLIDSI